MVMILPTLNASRMYINAEESPYEIISYVVRHYLSVPKNLTEVFNEESISFQYHCAQYSNDVTALCGAIRLALTTTLNRYFPNGSVSVSVSESLLETGTLAESTSSNISNYLLNFEISVTISGTIYNWNQNVSVDTDGNITVRGE